MEDTLNALQLNAHQVEAVTGVPRRRVQEMAEKGLIPHTINNPDASKAYRKYAISDLDKIKAAYEKYYPRRQPGRTATTANRLDSLEQVVSELVDRVNELLAELGQGDPIRDFPAEGDESPSDPSGE